jgi:hypothetical protein
MAVQWIAGAKNTPETISEWYSRATIACTPFIFPESRFRSPWVDDQFAEDVRRVRRWLTDNPCPDASVGSHLAAMLNSYAEMSAASVSRLMELREIVELHSKFVDRRAVPRTKP